jgi:D-sedoheptulose 7-phosphate isomerase
MDHDALRSGVNTRFKESIEASNQFLESDSYEHYLEFIKVTYDCLLSGNKIIFFGNGGSAAEATHIAAEFIGKCVLDVGPHAAISLNDSTSILTGIANDFGFEQVFQRQVEVLAKADDVLIGLTTSGNSSNVIAGLEAGFKKGAITALWTSTKFKNNLNWIDFTLRVPSIVTPRIQEAHLVMGHIMSEVISEMLSQKK